MSKAAASDSIDTNALELEGKQPRVQARRRILKAGTICFNDRHSTLACAVRDLSEEGARLRLSGSIDAPDTFELCIELDGLWVDCEVIWRGNSEIGVKFTSAKRQEKPKRSQVLQQQQTKIVKPSLRRGPKGHP